MPKKIAFLYNGELDFGGVETQLLSIFKLIDRRRYTPILISPISRQYYQKAGGLDVRVVPILPIKPFSLKAIWRLVKIFRQEKIDLVHMHSPIAAISGRIAARITGSPAVVTVHSPSTRFYGSLPTFRAAAGRALYISIDRILNYTLTKRIVYVSNTIYKESIQAHLSPAALSMVISNGIDLSKYSPTDDSVGISCAHCVEAAKRSLTPAPLPLGEGFDQIRSEYAKDRDAKVICFAGRLSEEKGIDILLDAMSELRKIYAQEKIQLWIIGDGAKKAELLERTNRLKLNGVVQFIGYQNDLSGFLHASDIFVLPSRHEGMSIVLLEAIACGLPCIVTEVGENAEVIENGIHGLVIPPNQATALTQALKTLLNDPALCQSMGAKARERARNYSDQKTVEMLQNLYHEILLE